MNREILFRGFHENKNGKDKICIGTQWFAGKWVYGTPIYQDGYVLIRFWNSEEFEFEEYLVLPETVSEYTGIEDREHAKIFEDDIIETQAYADRPYSKNKKEKRFVALVEYATHSFNGNRFYDSQVYDAEWRAKVKDYGKFVHGAWSDFWDCKVLGNRWSNPELLTEHNDLKEN